jgi:hypothetical protein
MGLLPDAADTAAGVGAVVRGHASDLHHAVVISNGCAGTENQCLGLLYALGLADRLTLYVSSGLSPHSVSAVVIGWYTVFENLAELGFLKIRKNRRNQEKLTEMHWRRWRNSENQEHQNAAGFTNKLAG